MEESDNGQPEVEPVTTVSGYVPISIYNRARQKIPQLDMTRSEVVRYALEFLANSNEEDYHQIT
jgi:hypothetical protein